MYLCLYTVEKLWIHTNTCNSNPTPVDRSNKMTELEFSNVEFFGDFSKIISNGAVQAKVCLE